MENLDDYNDIDAEPDELEKIVDGKHIVWPVMRNLSNQFADTRTVEVVAGLALHYRNWSIIRNTDNDAWEISHRDSPDITETEVPRVWDCLRWIDNEIQEERAAGAAVTPETEDCVLRA